MKEAPAYYVTGFYGCSCHPFKDWKESEKHDKQIFKVGDRVQNRCKGFTGTVTEVTKEQKYFYVVHYDVPTRFDGLTHSAELTPVINNPEVKQLEFF